MLKINFSKSIALITCFRLILFLLFLNILSCEDKTSIPKPLGQLRLTFPENKYKIIEDNLPFTFEKSIFANYVSKKKDGWIDLTYPKLKATIYISYYPINNNLNELIKNTEKLTFDKHTIKAIEIKSQPFENKEKKLYGSIFELTGNTATNLQFYLTDKHKHFLNGSLYFKVKPNYDSLLPAIKYLEKDIKQLMETTKWK